MNAIITEDMATFQNDKLLFFIETKGLVTDQTGKKVIEHFCFYRLFNRSSNEFSFLAPIKNKTRSKNANDSLSKGQLLIEDDNENFLGCQSDRKTFVKRRSICSKHILDFLLQDIE